MEPSPVEDNSGVKMWLDKDGKCHRVKYPAIIAPNGYMEWCTHGENHRVDGPAIIFSNGTEYYYINNEHVTEERWAEYVSSLKKGMIKCS